MTPAVFTIAAHRAFADALAAGLVARFGREKTGLARGIVLTPNNRAARAIQDAFVRRSGGGLLLPRLVPIGDPELNERLGGALEPIGEDDAIPPAIDPIERQFLLAGLIGRARGVGAAEALRLARELGRTLDQLLVEEIDSSRLASFAGEAPDLARHWEKSLEQLRVVLDVWPDVLAALGKIDLAARRNRLLDAAARRWRTAPPASFVCAAGVTTSAPAVARLLKAISGLPDGMVVLPALDLDMAEEEWRALGPHDPDPETGRRRPSIETHPQFHLKLLLDRMGVARGEVQSWRWGGGRDAPAARGRAIGHAMAPPAFTGRWETLRPNERRLSGVRALELADPAEEAQTIALALREALEEPGRTAALVTPDRGLARRVSAHLKRWGVVADDSAGRPLSETPPGTLLLALANAAAERFAPVPLLALLKHPLVRAGDERLGWLDGARRLDLALRGPRPATGLEGIALHLRAGEDREAKTRAAALPGWRDIAPLLEPLESAFANDVRLGPLLAAIREAAARLAGDAVWSGPAGRAAADLFARIEAAADTGPERVDPAELPVLLEQLLAAEAVRPPYGQHPRLSIWGLIEAQLQRADLMVLGGLNEGVWPALPLPDPWLAPRLRADLGLPSLERRIGLAAHDFAAALGAPQVLITRARRDARSPTIASRFWLRLEAMTGGVSRAPRLAAWARAIDRPQGPPRPAARPAPSPGERPRKLSVTEVDRLQADPFAFYARRILGLSSLDDVDAEPTAAWRGTAVHKVLEDWMREDDCDPAKLVPRAEALLALPGVHPLLRALWQPRLMEAIAFIAEEMAASRADGRRPLKAEASGRTALADVELSGKADRIDRLADGSLAIVDYKTGQPPSRKAVMEGFSLQLGLLGLIAEGGGFDGVEGAAAAFEYWSLARSKGRLGFVSSPLGGPEQIGPEEFLARAERAFAVAAGKWLTGDEPFTAKVKPEYSWPEYDQLMRLEEWYGRE
ncbi:double-strand break repair protein AddB [Sphingosinicella sp.]|uniref:double-strand break repair protein AddB n=1 Tax=Sphingosinicella sp. TaxID=1917971 RepID=UPI004037790B